MPRVLALVMSCALALAAAVHAEVHPLDLDDSLSVRASDVLASSSATGLSADNDQENLNDDINDINDNDDNDDNDDEDDEDDNDDDNDDEDDDDDNDDDEDDDEDGDDDENDAESLEDAQDGGLVAADVDAGDVLAALEELAGDAEESLRRSSRRTRGGKNKKKKSKKKGNKRKAKKGGPSTWRGRFDGLHSHQLRRSGAAEATPKGLDKLAPEPATAKTVPADPFAVPIPKAQPKAPAKPSRPLTAYDPLKDPLPYADRFGHGYRTEVHIADFDPTYKPSQGSANAGIADARAGVPGTALDRNGNPSHPQYDPVADPLPAVEGNGRAGILGKGVSNKVANTLNDPIYAKSPFKGHARKISHRDETWASGEFPTRNRVHVQAP